MAADPFLQRPPHGHSLAVGRRHQQFRFFGRRRRNVRGGEGLGMLAPALAHLLGSALAGGHTEPCLQVRDRFLERLFQ
jgi:hypothetical protein